MPPFSPFPGIRYDLDRNDPALVTAPPYDVIDAERRTRLAARDEHNIVLVDLPVGDAAEAGTGSTEDELDAGADPYRHAAGLLDAWLADGVLGRDEPAFYVYRMDHVDEAGTARHTTGVIGALELSRPGEGAILPHEQTTKKAKTDRLELQRATRTNMSSVWGLSPAVGLSALLEADGPPAASWVDEDGVTHSYWVVSDPDRQAAIAALVGAQPVVIADGHHRFETALNYRDEQRAADPGDGSPRPHDAFMCFVVELTDEQLTVAPIHRLVSGLADPAGLAAALEPFFVPTEGPPLSEVGPAITDDMASRGSLILVADGRSWYLRPRPDAFDGVRDLDTSRLDHALASLPPHSLVFQHGVDNVVRRVASGEQQAGFLVRPATVAQIVDIAHGGERMPPKTTFFHPKPATGVVIRPLD